MSNVHGSRSWLFVYAALASAGAALPLLLGWSHLPERIATHWGLGGTPDSAMSKPGLLVILLLVAALPLLGLKGAARSARPAPTSVAILVFSGLLTTLLSALVSWLNWGHASWTDAGELGLVPTLLLVGVPLSGAAAAFALARRLWPPGIEAKGALPTLPLVDGERAYWSGTASNRWFFPIALGCLVEGSVLALVLSKSPVGLVTLTVVHVTLIVVFVALGKIRVSVSERSVDVRYGPLGWPRQRIALERVLSAETLELLPLEHGGWGYRGSLLFFGRAAVVIRAGLALRLELDGDKRFFITVDDADSAARLINAFVSRRAGAPSPAR